MKVALAVKDAVIAAETAKNVPVAAATNTSKNKTTSLCLDSTNEAKAGD